MLRPFTHFLIFCLLLSFSPALIADQLIMKNGDIISGKVSRVSSDTVTIKPPYAGSFEVQLSEVESLITETPLEVEMADGNTVSALFGGVEDGKLILVAEEQVMPIDRALLREAAPPEKFYNRTSSADALVSINKGNTDSRRAILNLDTRLRLGEHRQYAKITLRRDEQNGVSTTKQNLVRYEYDWIFGKPWYLGFTGDYERDPIRDLSHRTTIGALIGRDFLNNSTSFLTIKAGLGYSDEKLGGVPESGLVGLWELFLEHDFGKLDLLHDHTLNYQHYGDNNTILKSNTSLRFDIYKQLYLSLAYRFDYETEPAPGKSSNDSTLAVGIGAKF